MFVDPDPMIGDRSVETSEELCLLRFLTARLSNMNAVLRVTVTEVQPGPLRCAPLGARPSRWLSEDGSNGSRLGPNGGQPQAEH